MASLGLFMTFFCLFFLALRPAAAVLRTDTRGCRRPAELLSLQWGQLALCAESSVSRLSPPPLPGLLMLPPAVHCRNANMGRIFLFVVVHFFENSDPV